MLELASAKNIGWQRFWFAIKHDVENYHSADYPRPYIIRPGEIAYAKGVVLADFWTFLQRNGYKLTSDERSIIKHALGSKTTKLGKPVMVLKRLGGGNYLVCRLSSWGGNSQVAGLLSPLQRYFAFSLSEYLGQWPPGTSCLRCSPPLKRTNAVMAIPVESNEVIPIGWKRRTFLSVGQLERLEAMIERRVKTFRSVAEELRQSEVEVQKLKRMPRHLWPLEMQKSFQRTQNIDPDDPEAPWNSKWPNHLRLHKGLRIAREAEVEMGKHRDKHAPRLPIHESLNLINWTYGRAFDDLVDCDFHMDPANPSGINVNYKSKRYRLPRILKGPGHTAVSRSVFPKPLVLRSSPSSRQVRSFSSVARFCGRATKAQFLPPFLFR